MRKCQFEFLVFREMGLGPDAIQVGNWEVGNSKARKKKDDEEETTGCWIKFRFMGSCMSARSKVESSISGSSTQYGIFLILSQFFFPFVLLLRYHPKSSRIIGT